MLNRASHHLYDHLDCANANSRDLPATRTRNSRLSRLTPALAMMVLLYATIAVRFSDGPIWLKFYDFVNSCCYYNWWATLLYINNYYDPYNMCVTQSWYLSSDFQLYLFSPVLLIPLHKRPKLGLTLAAVLVVTTTAGSLWNAFANDLRGGGAFTFDRGFDDILSKDYIVTHWRAYSFIMGMILGYVLFKIKQGELILKMSRGPPFGSCNMCDTENPPLPMAKLWAGWIISTFFILFSIFYITVLEDPEYEPNQILDILYMILHRHMFVLGFSWIILVCTLGHGGWLNQLLSWKFLIPFARLTYGAFLTHVLIQVIENYSHRVPIPLSYLYHLYLAVADFNLNYLVSAVLYLTVEGPCSNIATWCFLPSQCCALPKATLESQASLLPCHCLRDVTVRGGLRLNHLGVSHPHTFTYFHLSLTPVYCERLLTTGHICWGYCVCVLGILSEPGLNMPSKCCVPECKSNYVKPFVNVFSFPKDPETFRTWLRAIHRDGYEVTSNSRVCIKHFDERYIIKEDTVTRPDGTILTVKRDWLKLRNDAVPTIFENFPNYIGKDLPAERKDPEERRREAEERHQKKIQEEERRDTIDSFSCLTNNYMQTLTDESVLYLMKFVEWLEAWDSLPVQGEETGNRRKRNGKLTLDTQTALVHSTKTLLKSDSFDFNDIDFEDVYVASAFILSYRASAVLYLTVEGPCSNIATWCFVYVASAFILSYRASAVLYLTVEGPCSNIATWCFVYVASAFILSYRASAVLYLTVEGLCSNIATWYFVYVASAFILSYRASAVLYLTVEVLVATLLLLLPSQCCALYLTVEGLSNIATWYFVYVASAFILSYRASAVLYLTVEGPCSNIATWYFVYVASAFILSYRASAVLYLTVEGPCSNIATWCFVYVASAFILSYRASAVLYLTVEGPCSNIATWYFWYHVAADFTLSYLASALLYLTVEGPCGNIATWCFEGKKKPKVVPQSHTTELPIFKYTT
ncbi:hypothetical protein J6590_041547 [Homalodisca vitripennis]|nr:hypothetical protein J6590_041547 [Homalodisca vitripennis]